MRTPYLPIVLAAALPLGGCAYGLGGIFDEGDRYGYGMGGQDFEAMAVDASGAEASRYGRVQVTQARRASASTVRVYGTIDANYGYQRRSFGCTFREDGRIVDFEVN